MKTRAKKVNVGKLAEGCAIKIMGYHEFCCDSGWRASAIKKAFREGYRMGKKQSYPMREITASEAKALLERSGL